LVGERKEVGVARDGEPRTKGRSAVNREEIVKNVNSSPGNPFPSSPEREAKNQGLEGKRR